MNLGWQDLAALGIVFAAAGYLSRLAWGAFTRKSKSGCASGCGSCSVQSRSALDVSGVEPEQVVSIGALVSTSGKRTLPQAKVE
jgi:hypothetical protein